MPRSLAAGRRRVSIMTVKPADMAAPTKSELDAGIFASCRILATDYALGPDASETVSEPSLCDEIAPQTITNGAWATGSITAFRYFDATDPGKAETSSGGDDIGDAVFQALKTRAATLWIADRLTAKRAVDAFEEGDEVRVFEVQTDAWAQGEAEGYIKAVVPVVIQDGQLNAVVGASTDPPATSATAGAPGAFTPSGAATPADLAALADVTASPATAWTTGQHVVLGDASKAHWDGTAWNAGEAP